jgi:hypothetical protein
LNDLLMTDAPEDELKGLDVEDEEMANDTEAKVAEMERRLMVLEKGVSFAFPYCTMGGITDRLENE